MKEGRRRGWLRKKKNERGNRSIGQLMSPPSQPPPPSAEMTMFKVQILDIFIL